MLNFSKKIESPYQLNDFPLESYSLDIRMEHLTPGIDNVRHDVQISPGFHTATTKIIKRLLADRSGATDLPGLDNSTSKEDQKDDFRRLCSDVLKNILNQANAQNNFELYLLSIISIFKFIIQEFHNQFDGLIAHLKDSIKYYENKHGYTPKGTYSLVQRMGDVQKKKKSYYKDIVGQLMISIQRLHSADIIKMIHALFGENILFPDEFFFNPLLQADDIHDERFIMQNYNIFLAEGSEDFISYDAMKQMLLDLFHELDPPSEETLNIEKKKTGLLPLKNELNKLRQQRDLLASSMEKKENSKTGVLFKQKKQSQQESSTQELQKLDQQIADSEAKYQKAKEEITALQNPYDSQIEKWICHIQNIGTLFDCYKSHEQYLEMRRKKESWKARRYKKNLMRKQKRLLHFVYTNLKKKGLLKHIIISSKSLPIMPRYCPPLKSNQILSAILDSKERKKIAEQLQRFYPGQYSLDPLNDTIKEINRLNKENQKVCLVNFLIDFARYYRDLKNYERMINLIDHINLLDDDKLVELSKVNKTLYEIFLPEEEKKEEGRITGHVVLKADVRGSTKITVTMNERGLNPASHFSINFFIPISEILPLYDASKVFVEGDALILSIFEKTGSSNYYSVARACGLAQNILRIIRHYNEECIKNKLPILEIGVGICYKDSSPMFLFDGDHRIMISPALNLSDRLSSCSKYARKLFIEKSPPFNLYVFQTVPDEELETEDSDKLLLRYNVNGIQLNEEGFNKLSEEISLRCFELVIPGFWKEKTWIHAGRFPTLTGTYQNLFIRESRVARLDPKDHHFIEWTSRRYFEVCTNPKIREMIEKMLNPAEEKEEQVEVTQE